MPYKITSLLKRVEGVTPVVHKREVILNFLDNFKQVFLRETEVSVEIDGERKMKLKRKTNIQS